jgi:SHS2 domain-containing protein
VTEEGRRYDLVEVTADVAVRARGGSLSQLFANAAWGMYDLICDTATVEPRRTWEVTVASDDLVALMVDFLTELLVLFETEGALASEVAVEMPSGGPPWSLVATVRGEPFEAGRHELLHDIKAVTYHTLEVRPDQGWARVLFDI